VWSPDGGEVFYRSQHSLIAARVDVKGGFRVLDRTTLFSADNVYSGFDVHPAGDQFVMVSREQEEHLELVIVLNWLSTVRDRAASLSGGS
jgi:hypothetical protein